MDQRHNRTQHHENDRVVRVLTQHAFDDDKGDQRDRQRHQEPNLGVGGAPDDGRRSDFRSPQKERKESQESDYSRIE